MLLWPKKVLFFSANVNRYRSRRMQGLSFPWKKPPRSWWTPRLLKTELKFKKNKIKSCEFKKYTLKSSINSVSTILVDFDPPSKIAFLLWRLNISLRFLYLPPLQTFLRNLWTTPLLTVGQYNKRQKHKFQNFKFIPGIKRFPVAFVLLFVNFKYVYETLSSVRFWIFLL